VIREIGGKETSALPLEIYKVNLATEPKPEPYGPIIRCFVNIILGEWQPRAGEAKPKVRPLVGET